MVVSFAALWRAEPEVFVQAAGRWEAFGGSVAGHRGELVRVIDSVGSDWEGAARDAAVAHLDRIAGRAGRAVGAVSQIPPVLGEHGARVRLAQRLLWGAVAAAQGTGLVVGADGAVRIGPAGRAWLAVSGPVGLAVLAAHAQLVAGLIVLALELATRSDERATARLGELLPEPGRGSVGQSGAGRGVWIPASGSTPAQVAAWWAGLSEAQRYGLVHAHPGRIGNLDGIPAQVRDQANRARLPQQRAALEAEAARLVPAAADGDRLAAAQLDRVHDKLRALDAIEATLRQGDRQLLLLDTTGRRVTAAVAVGEVDTAEHVAVFTPGFTSTVESSLPGYDSELRLLREQAQQVAARYGDGESVAAVTWIGYEAPQRDEMAHPNRSVISTGQAQAGGRALGGFLDGIDAARPDEVHLTAIGHSYGSTTTGYAVQHATTADNVIFYGSPGIGTSDIGDLNVPPGQAYVIEAHRDPVADLGRFGTDPNQLDRITHLYSGAAQAPDGRTLTEVTGHSGYLTPDSTSQYNMSTIVAGVSDRAIYGNNTDLGDHLRSTPGRVGDFHDRVRDIGGGLIERGSGHAPGP